MIYGKAKTPKSDWPHHYKHDEIGVEVVKNMCDRLELPNDFKKAGMQSAKEHMRASLFYEMKVAKKVDFLVNNYKSKLGLEGLEIIVNSDKSKDKKEIHFSKLRIRYDK